VTVSARENGERGKRLIARRAQARAPSDAAVWQRVRLGLVSLLPSARVSKDAYIDDRHIGDEASRGRILQHFGPSHLRAPELGALQPTSTVRVPEVASGPIQPAPTRIPWKIWIALIVVLIPGLVALVSMIDLPSLPFGDWRADGRMATSTSSSSQDMALRGEPAIPRLTIQDVRGASGQPLFIGTPLGGLGKDAFVVITGLIPGMTLSTGSAIGVDAWRVPATEFAETWIGPPTGFAGAIDVTVELHLSHQGIAGRRQFRLEWSTAPVVAAANPAIPLPPAAHAEQAVPAPVDGPASSPTPAREPDKPSAPLEAGVNSVPASTDATVALRSPSVPPVPAQPAPAPVVNSHPPTSSRPEVAPSPASAMVRTGQFNAGQISALVERGRHFIASGDLAAARVALRRAAELEDAEAALVLGSTYDPVVLRGLKAYGFAPDPETARGWYERAKEFGSEEAQRRIEIMDRSGF